MSTTADLVLALKKELRAGQMTYADLALALGMAESSVKRMLSVGDMPLSRVDAICRILKLDFADLARRVADAQQLLAEMTQEQERAVVADKKLLMRFDRYCLKSPKRASHLMKLHQKSTLSTSQHTFTPRVSRIQI